LTHLGTPALAERRNIHVQISGMHQLGKPPYTELLPRIRELYKRYGAERLVYASNFPVMETEEVYTAEIDLLRSGRLGIPEKDIPQVMNANAERLWFAR
jgi:predicted TIM-barrel fold metal-dependent hydrolase